MGSGGGYAQVMQETRLPIGYRWLGRVGYDEAHAIQRRMVDERAEGGGADAFLALEHEPVLTLGKNATLDHLHLSEAEYAARGIALRRVERGGEVTYHGPGHLVAYPIIDLRSAGVSLRQHICALEDALIAACAHYGVAAERRDGAPGCWVGERKIGAVGVRVVSVIALLDQAPPIGRRRHGNECRWRTPANNSSGRRPSAARPRKNMRADTGHPHAVHHPSPAHAGPASGPSRQPSGASLLTLNMPSMVMLAAGRFSLTGALKASAFRLRKKPMPIST